MEPPDENSQQLRRLLALKRHEVPPPGFFATFSDRVRARIEMEMPQAPIPWWRRLAGLLDVQQVLAGGHILTFAGLAFVGVSLYLVMSGDTPTTPGVGTAFTVPQAAGVLVPSAVALSAGGSRLRPHPPEPSAESLTIQVGIPSLDFSAEGSESTLFPAARSNAPGGRFAVPTLQSLSGDRVRYPVYRPSLQDRE